MKLLCYNLQTMQVRCQFGLNLGEQRLLAEP